MGDEALLARKAAGGDRAALGELLGLHRGAAYALALAVAGEPHDAEDACQEAFLRAVRSVTGLQREASFRAWLLALVRAAAIDLVRKRIALRGLERGKAMEASTTVEPARTDPELSGALRGALMSLEEKYRLPVLLQHSMGLTRSEIARTLDLPEGTVSTHVNRGVERLRESLVRAGFSAAALAGALGSLPMPEPPASLEAAIASALREPTVAAAKAAKGGIAMKIVVGVVLAGTLAGIAAVATGVGAQHAAPLQSPPAPAGPPKLEKFALAVNREYLDGPRMEAMCMDHKEGWPDAAGNVFFRAGMNDGGALRVARADGMVETVVGDDRLGLDLGLAEGPASFFPSGGAGISILGAPLEGEDKGAIFASIGSGLYKIYRNKDKDGRWWFKRQGKAGGGPPPAAVGKSALIAEIDTAGLGIQPDCARWKGNVYRVDLAKGELTCVLTLADYEEKVQEALKAAGQKWNSSENGRPIGPAEGAALSDNGTIFIQYYGTVYPRGRVFRIPADRSKVEEVVRDTKGGNKDGPGLETGWHCGPNSLYGARGDSVFICAIDSNAFRRWKDGRVSTLMKDGEWREVNRFPAQDGVVGKGKSMGPPGSLPYVWIPYPGEEMGGANGIFRYGPVDFAKPTAGSSAGGK